MEQWSDRDRDCHVADPAGITLSDPTKSILTPIDTPTIFDSPP